MAAAVVDLTQASKAVNAEAAKRNGKIVEQIPNIISEMAKQRSVYIFNVGPKPWSRNLGSLGNFHVEGCAEGAEISAPLVIPGVLLERVATEMNKMSNRYEEGMDIAKDVMFIGRGYSPELNREKWGLFISETKEPTKAAIKAAKAKLRESYADLVAKADSLERNNKRDQISEIHRDAATSLGVTKPWLSAEPREADECPACHKRIDMESVICPECSAILDLEGAKKYHPEKYMAYVRANAPAAPAAK